MSQHKTPPGYEQKFAEFIKMCAEAKTNGISHVIVSQPAALGDNYDEIIESLWRLADADLALNIAAK